MPTPSLLMVRSVSKSFGAQQAVDSLSFQVKKGEIFALLGPNGAGKTTTVRMLMQIIQPDSGSIAFDLGLPTSGPIQPHVGYLPEDRGLFKEVGILKTMVYMGILRGMSRQDAHRDALVWLEKLELADRAKDRLDTLSKGNQQKVQFAAAILHKPVFAVLDEPFSGFDPVNQDLFVDIISQLRKEGTTVLLSAHQMPLVERLADRILLMNAGREALQGTVGELTALHTARCLLRLTLGGPLNNAIHLEHPAIASWKSSEPDTLEIHLKDTDSLSDLLTYLSRELDIRDIHRDRPDLHQIYIQTLAAAKEKGESA